MRSARAVYRTYRVHLLLGLGIPLLLASALYAPGITLTDDYTQYEALEVDHDEDGLSTVHAESETEIDPPRGIDGILCGDYRDGAGQLCSLVYELDDGAEIETAHSPVGGPSEYGYQWESDEFVELTATTTEDNETVVDLEPVDAETVFDDLAVEEDRLTTDERTVVEDGQVRTTERLPENQLLEFDGEYYLLEETGTYDGAVRDADCGITLGSDESFCEELRPWLWLESGATVLGFVLGGGLVVQGYRRAVGHEFDRERWRKLNEK
ncbi:hypothetical protein [Natronorubrum daqingense]|uniref:Uncharacterized protein n=1 Tax=Natronorubrum daqingense TaxID=588898 RepID=A0A1N7F460_9EURY|nr:hypothetical protein [Natronorubrum daqingense]APX97523.1 hypothetical protein BB347_13410 [Natronorubrum daqingense]SIR95157.1 hypothetical protein SAMN05421809_2993 [Natronorubrum daqingense]